MNTVVNRDLPLADLLSRASQAELAVLADVITDSGRGRVSLSKENLLKIQSHRLAEKLHLVAGLLADELVLFGGNSFMNVVRSSKLDYREIASDVAAKLGAKVLPEDDLFEIEEKATQAAIKKHGKPNEAGTSEVGDSYSTEAISAIIGGLVSAGGTVAGIAGTGAATGIMSFVGGRLATLVAPPAAVAGLAYTANEVAGPAFRVTTPAVLQIALIRRRQMDDEISALKKELEACM